MEEAKIINDIKIGDVLYCVVFGEVKVTGLSEDSITAKVISTANEVNYDSYGHLFFGDSPSSNRTIYFSAPKVEKPKEIRDISGRIIKHKDVVCNFTNGVSGVVGFFNSETNKIFGTNTAINNDEWVILETDSLDYIKTDIEELSQSITIPKVETKLPTDLEALPEELQELQKDKDTKYLKIKTRGKFVEYTPVAIKASELNKDYIEMEVKDRDIYLTFLIKKMTDSAKIENYITVGFNIEKVYNLLNSNNNNTMNYLKDYIEVNDGFALVKKATSEVQNNLPAEMLTIGIDEDSLVLGIDA